MAPSPNDKSALWLSNQHPHLGERSVLQVQRGVRERQPPKSPPQAAYLTYLTPFYVAVVRCRNWLYDKKFLQAKRLPGRVISVGNLTVGGTGKSPMILELAKHACAQGLQPAILTRGYKSGLPKHGWAVLLNGHVVAGEHIPEAFHPDEARMQSYMLPDVPVIVGALRYAAAQKFLAVRGSGGFRSQKAHMVEQPECALPVNLWLLDDGFQHRQIYRDVDLVLIDAALRLGSGHCLPAGRLREPPSALLRADSLVFTRWEPAQESACMELARAWGKPYAAVRFHTQLPTSPESARVLSPESGSIVVACAIADTEAFVSSLRALGFSVGATLLQQDHTRFSREVLESLCAGSKAVVTTAKDYYRDVEIWVGLPVYVAGLELEWLRGSVGLCLGELGQG